jgi:hypothetical protein
MCSVHGGVWLGYLQEGDHMEELAILEYVIEMDHEERGWECMGYFFLSNATTCLSWTSWSPSRLSLECN